MHRYIGIDVHTESCTFAIMGPTGKRLRETTVETNGKVLTDTVQSIAGKKHVCIEEGTHADLVAAGGRYAELWGAWSGADGRGAPSHGPRHER